MLTFLTVDRLSPADLLSHICFFRWRIVWRCFFPCILPFVPNSSTVLRNCWRCRSNTRCLFWRSTAPNSSSRKSVTPTGQICYFLVIFTQLKVYTIMKWNYIWTMPRYACMYLSPWCYIYLHACSKCGTIFMYTYTLRFPKPVFSCADRKKPHDLPMPQ
jgi:hypothetical protein